MTVPDQADLESLSNLESRVRQDLENLCLYPPNWVPQHILGEQEVQDIVIIGGGMCGMLVYHALQCGGMRNTRILDRNPEGFEGPWLTYARMETLRSPKQLTGPAYGMGPLTFRAWYVARFGESAWSTLDKIPRTLWMDYLKWYRNVLNIPVENEVDVERIEPDGDYLRLTLTGRLAPQRTLLARKVVMATGREGMGHPNIPEFIRSVPRQYWAHSADGIDFPGLKDKRVIVVGGGASAVDNSAEALEAGAKEVRHLIRRKEMPRINKMMGIGSFGFTAGYARLSDAWRWRFMQYSFATQTPAPRGSTLRVSQHENAYFHFGHAIDRVDVQGEELLLTLASGATTRTDYLILGTGFTIESEARTEFGDVAGKIQLWRDVYQSPPGEESEELGSFPYLNPDFTFREKSPGDAPWLSNVYCFNYGASASLGKVSGDIPGISEGASWLTRELAAKLYCEDVEAHWQGMLDYSKPELLGDEWRETELPVDQEGAGDDLQMTA